MLLEMRSVVRNVPRKWRRSMLVIALFFAASSVMTFFVREEALHMVLDGYLEQVLDPFGSRTSRLCAGYVPNGRQHQQVFSEDEVTSSQDMCYSSSRTADLQIENVWDEVSVGYPYFVLSVTGWHDTVHVRSWTVKPLHVIIVPHSHQDPGWLQTLDQYFSLYTKSTLDLMVEKLTANPSWKFVWAEVVFLDMWWDAASDTKKEQLKSLLRTGQLEVVSGGWVMTDESVAIYAAMLDQLIEGHQWLKGKLNITIENSWSVDSFGHSSTMAYLLGQSGIRNMVIQRTHFAIKKKFAAEKNLEFFWRQEWDEHGSNDVFCHMMPFLSYSIPYSCGPDRHICCMFDFHQKQCFFGHQHSDILTVNEDNVADLAIQFWKQLQKKSELYRNNVVLVPHGDDFRYSKGKEWDNQFGNLQRIIEYINAHTEMKTKVEFGTLKDYFKLVETHRSEQQSSSYPVLSGDLFPYSDRGDQYWSGLYTTRPVFKYLVRQLQQLCRSAEILFTFSLSSLTVNSNMAALFSRFQSARRTLALVHHHDAITGTSKRAVVDDYYRRVKEALAHVSMLLRNAVSTVLGKAENQNVVINMTENFHEGEDLPRKVVLKLDKPIRLLLWNDLAQEREEVMHVVVDRPDIIVVDAASRPVRYQISPVWNNHRQINTEQYLLSLNVNINALSLEVFTIRQANTSGSLSALYCFTDQHQERPSVYRRGQFQMRVDSRHLFSLSNKYLNVTFKACDGMLLSVRQLGTETVWKADAHFVTYSTGRHTQPFRDKSGPYIFLPDGIAQELIGTPEVVVTEGALFSEVRAIYKDIVHVSRLYHVSGPVGRSVYLENYVEIGLSNWDNTELVLRVETNIFNKQQHFCTDTNGYQVLRRKTRPKMSLQGNIYPMTTTAMLEDDNSRLTLLSTQSEGVASLVSGWLEVVLDRRLLQGDWRGLNEDLTDNALTKASFLLLFETKHPSSIKTVPSRSNSYYCLPTALSHFLTKAINSPLKTFSTSLTSGISRAPYLQNLLRLPCGWHLLNVRLLKLSESTEQKEALLTIHRSGLDCSFPVGKYCKAKRSVKWSDLALDVFNIAEMTLTGVIERKTYRTSDSIDVKPMEIKTYKIAFR